MLLNHIRNKKYLKNYEEVITEGFGHGESLMKHSQEYCEKIHKTILSKGK